MNVMTYCLYLKVGYIFHNLIRIQHTHTVIKLRSDQCKCSYIMKLKHLLHITLFDCLLLMSKGFILFGYLYWSKYKTVCII